MTTNRETTAAPDVRFKDYLLQNVYLRTSEIERSEIVALWETEGAITDPTEARRRTREAVFLVRNGSGELAGVSTVGFARTKDGRDFYALRMFLRKRDRVPNLMLQVVLATRDFLRTFRHPDLQPAGIIHVNENPKLMRPGARRVFERIGYRYWGKTEAGEDVWGVEFDQQPRAGGSWQDILKRLANLRAGERHENLVMAVNWKSP